MSPAAFNTLVTASITMPAIVVLSVMAVYYLRRRYCEARPARWFYVVLAALTPMVLLLFNWPPGAPHGDAYGYGYDYDNFQYRYEHSYECLILVCLYSMFYVSGFLIYYFCCKVREEYRHKVFRFFFAALLVAVFVSLCVTAPARGYMLIPFISALTMAVFLLYHLVKAGAELLAGPHKKIMAWMMVVLFPSLAIASQLSSWYVPLVAFWVWVAVQSMIWNKPAARRSAPEEEGMQPAAYGQREGVVSPSPSPPSPGTG